MAADTPATVDRGDSDIESLILKIVKDDPFASIGQISQQVVRLPGGRRGGWWRVFGVLRRRHLLRRRSRFAFVRQRK